MMSLFFTGAPIAPSEAEYSIVEDGILFKWSSAGGEPVTGYLVEGFNNGNVITVWD